MAASVFSSAIFSQLFPTGEIGKLFSDTAEIRAMLLVEGALAEAQGKLGIIPEISAAAIVRAAREIQIDPGALAKATGQNGVVVPALVTAFRAEMQAPEHAQYVHWGATSQDIIDTGLMLRLRQCLTLAETTLIEILRSLADQAEAHAETAMAARTYGQHATPTSWGAVVAQHGAPLVDIVGRLGHLREVSLWISLGGAAGTSSVFGDTASQLRADLACGLNLRDPGRSWHTDRGPILRLAEWFAAVTAALAGFGQTVIGLTSSETGEIRLSGAGASSTMPQKQNPVGPSALVALNHQMGSLRAGLQSASAHQHQRDGAAWFAEWMLLPQLVLTGAAALEIAKGLVVGIEAVPARMARNLEADGFAFAEALSFALAKQMPRPDAQTVVKTLCRQAVESDQPLPIVAQAAHPDLAASLFDPTQQWGDAPAAARAFVRKVREA